MTLDSGHKKRQSKIRKLAVRSCLLDKRYPTPLITKTLGVVSNLANTVFDLLDSREEDHFIADLEHLLLADFPDHEIREATRVSFAAGKLARLGGRRLLVKFRISEIERRIVQTERSLKEAASCSDEARLKRLSDDLERLNAEKREMEDECAENINREQRRIFSLLVRAVQKHPEKLKLWFSALEFCERTGHDGIHRLAEVLSSIRPISVDAAAYLRAFIWQRMARQVMRCARRGLTHAVQGDQTRASESLKYSSILQEGRFVLVPSRVVPRFFECSSWHWLNLALSAIETELRYAARTHNLPEDVTRGIETYGTGRQKRAGAKTYIKKLDEEKCYPDSEMAVRLWWCDYHLTERGSTKPSGCWQQHASELDPKDAMSWAAWSKYPQWLPDRAIDDINLLSELPGAEHLGRNQGWLYDVARGVSRRRTDLRDTILEAPLLSELTLSLRAPKGFITLDQWAEKAGEFHAMNPWDPRAGEWTCLEIIRQVAVLISSKKHRDVGLHIHPANYLMPKRWCAPKKDVPSWEKWRGRVRQPKSAIQLRELGDAGTPLIQDQRYTLDDGPDTEVHRRQVRGLGMMLLGLLARSFYPSFRKSDLRRGKQTETGIKMDILACL